MARTKLPAPSSKQGISENAGRRPPSSSATQAPRTPHPDPGRRGWVTSKKRAMTGAGRHRHASKKADLMWHCSQETTASRGDLRAGWISTTLVAYPGFARFGDERDSNARRLADVAVGAGISTGRLFPMDHLTQPALTYTILSASAASGSCLHTPGVLRQQPFTLSFPTSRDPRSASPTALTSAGPHRHGSTSTASIAIPSSTATLAQRTGTSTDTWTVSPENGVQ